MSDVTWFGGAYLALSFFSVLLTISQVGEPRKPLTFGSAGAVAICNALIVWGLFTVGVRS